MRSKTRHRSSKSSFSSLSSGNDRGDIVDGRNSGNTEKEISVSQPGTLERGTKDQSKKSRSKHDSQNIGSGSLPRSPFFGSRKQEKGGLLIFNFMMILCIMEEVKNLTSLSSSKVTYLIKYFMHL